MTQYRNNGTERPAERKGKNSPTRAKRQTNPVEPVVFDPAYHFEKRVQIAWLGQVAIGVVLVGADDIALGVGGTHHDHWNLFQARIGLHRFQHLPSIDLG